jgi:hypothetical protein
MLLMSSYQESTTLPLKSKGQEWIENSLKKRRGKKKGGEKDRKEKNINLLA